MHSANSHIFAWQNQGSQCKVIIITQPHTLNMKTIASSTDSAKDLLVIIWDSKHSYMTVAILWCSLPAAATRCTVVSNMTTTADILVEAILIAELSDLTLFWKWVDHWCMSPRQLLLYNPIKSNFLPSKLHASRSSIWRHGAHFYLLTVFFGIVNKSLWWHWLCNFCLHAWYQYLGHTHKQGGKITRLSDTFLCTLWTDKLHCDSHRAIPSLWVTAYIHSTLIFMEKPDNAIPTDFSTFYLEIYGHMLTCMY